MRRVSSLRCGPRRRRKANGQPATVPSWSSQTWSVRPATADDGAALTDIVIEATKAQGLWPAMSQAAEDDWRQSFIDWSGEQVTAADPCNSLSVIEEGGRPIGRLRIVRNVAPDTAHREEGQRIELAGIQLRPAWQRRGIRDRDHPRTSRRGSSRPGPPRHRGRKEQSSCPTAV